MSMRITFTDMAYGGDAVGRDPDSGVAVFAWPGIRDEQADVEVTSRRTNLLRGRVTTVLAASPLRTDPPCSYYGRCGGCQWQHIAYEGQIRFKQDIVSSQLARSAGIADPGAVLLPSIASPLAYHYRNTSHFAIDPRTLSLAYFGRESHGLVPVDDCPISCDLINATIPFVNGLLRETVTPEAAGAAPKGMMSVWNIAVRASETTGQVLLVFHTRTGAYRGSGRRAERGGETDRPDAGPTLEPRPEAHPSVSIRRRDVRSAVLALGRADGGAGSISLAAVEVMDDGTLNLLGETAGAHSLAADAAADAMLGSSIGRSEVRTPEGRGAAPLGAWVEELEGRRYWVAPDAFFQVNTRAAALLLNEVRRQLPPVLGLIVDAHAGVGTFSLDLAGRAKHVIGFDTHGPAIDSARWTAAAEHLGNVEFRQGQAEKLMPKLAADLRPDAVLLDPPRAGVRPELLAEIARRHVPVIVYVSCDPSTLARDIRLLEGQYSLAAARMIDMFPQTYHIETVAVLKYSAAG